MSEMPSIVVAAEQLRRAHDTHVPCQPVRDFLPQGDVAAAYAVQETNTEHRLRSGAPPGSPQDRAERRSPGLRHAIRMTWTFHSGRRSTRIVCFSQG